MRRTSSINSAGIAVFIRTHAVNIFAAVNYILTATTISAQPLFGYHIIPSDEYQRAEVPGWNDDRPSEHTAWNSYMPMKMMLRFESVPYTCYSNFMSFQIADGNITLYLNTSENTIFHGRKYPADYETKQTNTFILTAGSQICHFKLAVQVFEIIDGRWQAKNTGQSHLVERDLVQILKKLRDERTSDTERSELTAERKRLEAEMEKTFGAIKDQVKKAIASKGFKEDQISNKISLETRGMADNIPHFPSNSLASEGCFFGSGHIDFSGVNPSLAYVANPPTERPGDNWFEVRAGYSTSGNGYDIFFSNRKCAIRIEFSKEVKKAGNWINVPISEH